MGQFFSSQENDIQNNEDEYQSFFQMLFGFKEEDFSYQENKNKFDYDKKTYLLKSKVNQKVYNVGKFDLASNIELQQQIANLRASISQQQQIQQQSNIKFENISGNIVNFILDSLNQGSVFQAASQFNVLEMASPGTTPEKGITIYIQDNTQGPKCAITCPAGTVFRNYFLQGSAQKEQVNTLLDMEKILENDKNKYWNLQNGYCLPVLDQIGQSMKQLSEVLQNNKVLYQQCYEALRVGIHWDTEVDTKNKENHSVCQIYCSGCPIGYSNTSEQDWEVFAKLILDSAYDSVFAAAYIQSLNRNQRVKVFLTKLGGGVFANPHQWIIEAIQKAINKYRDASLDIYLVHYGKIDTIYQKITF